MKALQLKVAASDPASGRLEASLELPPTHPHFRGHFEGFPILPGVTQVELVNDLLSHALAMPLIVRGVQKAKFMALLRPDAKIRAVVDYADGTARWSLHDQDDPAAIYSRGTMLYDRAASDA